MLDVRCILIAMGVKKSCFGPRGLMFKVASSWLGCLAHSWRILQILGLCRLEGFAFKCPEDSSCAVPHGGAFEYSKLSEGVKT